MFKKKNKKQKIERIIRIIIHVSQVIARYKNKVKTSPTIYHLPPFSLNAKERNHVPVIHKISLEFQFRKTPPAPFSQKKKGYYPLLARVNVKFTLTKKGSRELRQVNKLRSFLSPPFPY
jgi:hypothetical protein